MTVPLRSLPVDGRDAGERLLVVVHGYREPPELVLRWIDVLDPDGRCTVLAPLGPFEREGRPIWYRPLFHESGRGEQQFAASLVALRAFCAEEADRRGLDPATTVLVGFSQGAGLALAAGIDAGGGTPLSGVVAFCGFAPPVGAVDPEHDRGRLAPAVLLAAEHDPWVPLDTARHSADVLDRLGVRLAYHEVPGGHEVGPEAAGLAGDWLARLWAGAPPETPVTRCEPNGLIDLVEPLWGVALR